MKNYNKICGTYMDLQESMEQLVQNPDDAFFILWFDIHDWLEPKDSAWRADLCGLLTSNMMGKNIGTRVCIAAEHDKPYYQEILTRYGFGESIDELGDYWKELIREEKLFCLRLLLGCLKVYHDEIMPYTKNEMVTFFKRNGRDFPELSPTLKPYKEHQARIKETMQIIEMAINIFSLKTKVKNNSKET